MTTLTAEQKRELVEQGYLRVRNVVPLDKVNAALKAINHSLGEGIDPAQIQIFRSRSYAPELQRQAVITDLYNATPACELAQSLIGAHKPVEAGQIALRFPLAGDTARPPAPHLDGMYTPTNGVPEGRILSFTMLLGVVLSDVHEPWSGNLTVWPRTHHVYERYFREHGPEALLNGMPAVELPEPVHLTADAGDIFLAHYQLAHGAAPNLSPNVRYAIYFRLMSPDHNEHWKESMTDIWKEWPGLRD